VRRCRVLFASSTLALWGAGCIHLPTPQRPAPQPGQRIRVTVRNTYPARVTGAVVALTADSIVLRPDRAGGAPQDSSRLALALADVRRIELSRGVHSAWPEGVVLGAGVGAVVALLGFTQGEWAPGDPEWYLAFSACTLAGGVIAATVRVERWRRIR
jgi:hypothetical protein